MSSSEDLPAPLRALVDATVQRWRSGPRPAEGDPAVALAAAIEAGAVAPVYQPIVRLPGGDPVAVEALVRIPSLTDPRLGDATHIVAVAEASGLIVPLGLEVLGRACVQLRRWRRRARTRDLRVNVNVSPFQLREDRFVDQVHRTLEVTGLPASALVLEITETAAFEGDGVAEGALFSLARLGVELAVDDFETGFASLELLAATPARSIKLDRSFVGSVGDLREPPRGRATVVQATIGLGRSLGLRIVAEGIERSDQVRTLTAWGCEFGQGYLFGGPPPRRGSTWRRCGSRWGTPPTVPDTCPRGRRSSRWRWRSCCRPAIRIPVPAARMPSPSRSVSPRLLVSTAVAPTRPRSSRPSPRPPASSPPRSTRDRRSKRQPSSARPCRYRRD
ncbi:MAG: EAL domain-containing protein [Nitriliruptor sp.]